MTRCVLGIDTSNYTTSVCAIAWDDGALLAEERALLPVQSGQRGLRQSEALFFHVQRLPALLSQLVGRVRPDTDGTVAWEAIGVSVRPRPFATSYMPVFTAGQNFARAFSAMLGVPVIQTSHQEGHLAAAEAFLSLPGGEPVLAVHLSGGTSDVLYARRTDFGYAIDTLGEGADLHAGQFVDHVGVALGLPFPAGPGLERLADETVATPTDIHFAATVRHACMSFSGPCSAALRAVGQGVVPGMVALAVFQSIANSVAKAIHQARHQVPSVQHCMVAGGVAANRYVRDRIGHRLRITDPDLTLHFAPARFSSDNALGPARIAWHHQRLSRSQN